MKFLKLGGDMIKAIWTFMDGFDSQINIAKWIWNNIFIDLSDYLWNWHLICKAEPWPIIPLDTIASLVLVCILLYVLWVGGSIIIWFGVMPAITMVWIILWIFYYFAIPICGALIITELIRLPKRWQKLLVLIGTIIYFDVIKSHFDYQLAIWYNVMSIVYILILLEIKPYKALAKTSS